MKWPGIPPDSMHPQSHVYAQRLRKVALTEVIITTSKSFYGASLIVNNGQLTNDLLLLYLLEDNVNRSIILMVHQGSATFRRRKSLEPRVIDAAATW